MKTILSIDGGGIRGVIPAYVLAYIEKLLIIKSGDNNIRIADCFQLLSGTSAGGILTALYLTCEKDNTGAVRPKYTAPEICSLFEELGPALFKRSFGYWIKSCAGLTRSRYNEDALYHFSNKIFGDAYISEAMKDCLITAYDLGSRKALLFSRYSTLKYGKTADYKMCDIVRATSAAPSYFIPALIKARDNSERHLVDGGVYAGNPAMCALVESVKLWPQMSYENRFMLSLGCGKVIKPYHYHKTKRFGYLHWLHPILDILMSSVSETVNYQVQQLFAVNGVPENFIRIDPPILTADSRIDNASRNNMKKLHSAAQNFIDHNQIVLDKLCDTLLKSLEKDSKKD